MRGYFGIGIYHTKTEVNVGTLWRSAHNFGAAFIFTIARRYKRQASDTTKAWKTIPLHHYESFADFRDHIPFDCQLIAIEQSNKSESILKYSHPERAIYLLGAEDSGIPAFIQEKCQGVVHIDTPMCLNVATAGAIIMYDRKTKEVREQEATR